MGVAQNAKVKEEDSLLRFIKKKKTGQVRQLENNKLEGELPGKQPKRSKKKVEWTTLSIGQMVDLKWQDILPGDTNSLTEAIATQEEDCFVVLTESRLVSSPCCFERKVITLPQCYYTEQLASARVQLLMNGALQAQVRTYA